MNITENFKMALSSIFSNKMRSFLTMLGIIIGISSVIMIVSVGDGGKESIMGQLNQIGAATVQIKVDTKSAGVSDYITKTDIDAIRQKLPYVKYATPALQKMGSVSAQNTSKDAVVICGNEDYGPLENLTYLYGRFFSKQEVISNSMVAVIDNNTATAIFGTTNAVGYTMNVNIKTTRYKVKIIGVIKSQMGMFGTGKNVPAMVYMPVTTILATTQDATNTISSILVMANSKDQSDSAGNAAISMLEARHGNRGQEIYSYQNLIQQVDQLNSIINIFTEFISAVAAISLLVGGIGVMNIMLVAVTERTREIGIRKSLGAKTGTIMIQFLTESVIITFIGGFVGIVLGILGARIVGGFVGVTPLLSPATFIIAILFSCAVGIFFGIYPAQKAAKLNPIDALRHD
jgi:putative ABC transport system permease protein